MIALGRTALLLGGLSLWTGGPVAAQVVTPELAGRWKYNEARSDRIEDKLPPDPYFGTGTSATPPAGRGAPPTGGAPGTAAGPRQRPRSQNPAGEIGLVAAIRRPAAEIQVALDDTTVTITDDTGRVLLLRTDGKKVAEDVGTIRMERKASWDKKDLVVEEKVKDGGTLRYTLRYDTTLKRLTLLVRYSGPRYPLPVEMRRVYDRLPDSAAAGPPRAPPSR